MSFWTSLTSIFSKEVTAVETYLQPLIAAIEADAGPILMDVASTVVSALEATPLAGASKLSVALTAIENTFKANGLPYLENAARGAVEAAVAALPANAQQVATMAAAILPTTSSNAVVAAASTVVQQGIADAAKATNSAPQTQSAPVVAS